MGTLASYAVSSVDDECNNQMRKGPKAPIFANDQRRKTNDGCSAHFLRSSWQRHRGCNLRAKIFCPSVQQLLNLHLL